MIYYFGLEPYQERYTLQLQDWAERALKARGVEYSVVQGAMLSDNKEIVTGSVLDAHSRCYFAMSQIQETIKLLKNKKVSSQDVLFFEDMFHPGIESLAYILDQTPEEFRPKIFVRCLAQTIDPDDFVHVTGMTKWMSKFEYLVNEIVDGILCTNEEMVAHAKIAGWTAPLYNISGLTFDADEVRSRVQKQTYFHLRKNRVVFSARWDQEKQPHFYMDLVERVKSQTMSKFNVPVEFCVVSGGKLKSNDPTAITRLREMQERGLIQVHEHLSKNEYYEILADSKVVFNCALQDWVSNTVSEADALGCNVLYPAYRSFPETFANDYSRLYVPWSLDDAIAKLGPLLANPSTNIGKISEYTSSTMSRIIDVITGNGEHYRRDTIDYRKHTSERKY